MSDMEPVGVQVPLDMNSVGGHGVKAQNGKVLVEDPRDQNGKPRGQNGKEHEGDIKDDDAKDASSDSEDSRHICEDEEFVADERNGLGHGRGDGMEDPLLSGSGVGVVVPLDGSTDMMEDVGGTEYDEPTTTRFETGHQTEYVSLCIAHGVERKAMDERLQQFKSEIVSKLESLKQDTIRNSVKLRDLQSRYNHALQDKRRLQQAKDKANREMSVKERAVKEMQIKLNQTNQMMMRGESQVLKVKKEAESRREQLLRLNEKLKEENAKLLKKVEDAKMDVEAERKEKLSVKLNNQEYLRNERQKMGRELQKELVHTRSLEDQVIGLQEQIESTRSESEKYQSRCLGAEKRTKSEELKAQKACKERDDAVQSLQRKSRLFREQQSTLRQTQQEMDRLVKQSLTQKTEIRKLQEAVRKKSQFEKDYDSHKMKLNDRERKLRERERIFDEKSKKASSSRRQPKTNPSSPSKSSKRSTRTQNKGNTLRDLPFHWLSLFLLILLMISIAQKR